MVVTIKSIKEKVLKFNSQKKYLCSCSFCNNSILFTKDELNDNIIKCPYCGHWEKIRDFELDYMEYDIKIQLKTGSEFNSESFLVI